MPVANEYARAIEIEGRRFEPLPGPKPRIDLPVREHCQRRIDVEIFQDGLKRPLKPPPAGVRAKVQGFRAGPGRHRRRATAPDVLRGGPATGTVAARDRSRRRPEILRDVASFDRVHLFYRPVFAFEYVWSTSGKIGVIEIDGLTGDVVENGEWFRDRFEKVVTCDMLFELGAEAATTLVPGGGFAVKVLGKLTQ